MATATFSHLKNPSIFSLTPLQNHYHHSPSSIAYPFCTTHFTKTSISNNKTFPQKPTFFKPHRSNSLIAFSGGSGGGNVGGSGGGGGGGGDDDEDDAGERNKKEAILALAEAGRSLDTIPKDLAAAIEAGRIPGSIVYRFFELEKSPFLKWLMRFGGFKERLLADDLFLTKVGIECGVGIFTKV